MKKILAFGLYTLILSALFISCNKEDNLGVNLFSIEDDKKLGAQMEQYIRDSSNYILLKPEEYPAAYNYINTLKNQILSSEHIRHKDDFEWKVTIIKDDTTLNAFATPGGYIYVYTGLMKYLTCDDHFAGVLGHEIAHADRRHSTRQLTKLYGIQTLFDIVLGKNQGMISQVTTSLIGLSFSRDMESEADEFSVKYLCGVPDTEADGAAGFFKKLIEEGHGGGTPQFLSTHPSPDNRVSAITEQAKSLGCDTIAHCSADYATIVSSLK